jgi:tRNA threonylcarbamoyladenosine dehydratase
MGARITDINPEVKLHLIDDFVTSDNVQELLGTGVQVLVDAIDQPRAKAAMIAWARANKIPVFVCGAAGGRKSATVFALTDIALVKGDALIASVRGRLRRDYEYSRVAGEKFGVIAVHSLELPQATKGNDGGLNCGGYGSSVMVTAAMGFTAANAAIERILK